MLSEHGIQTVPAGTVMRDIYRLHRELFADPTIAWGYAAAVGVRIDDAPLSFDSHVCVCEIHASCVCCVCSR